MLAMGRRMGRRIGWLVARPMLRRMVQHATHGRSRFGEGSSIDRGWWASKRSPSVGRVRRAIRNSCSAAARARATGCYPSPSRARSVPPPRAPTGATPLIAPPKPRGALPMRPIASTSSARSRCGRASYGCHSMRAYTCSQARCTRRSPPRARALLQGRALQRSAWAPG